MMFLNDKNIKTFSMIGSRATLGMCALELASENPDLIILTSDVSTSAGLDRYRKKFPQQYLEVGIAEQNLIGIAAGLSSEGFDVITTTFAPFQTMRCCEQIKVNLGYMKNKVTMIGLASGLVLGNLGFTHCSIEDISVMRSIPNLTVISPADTTETVKAIESSISHFESTYIRLTGTSNSSLVYKKDYDFKIGEPDIIKIGKDICIIATGPMVHNALQVCELLQNNNINASLINIHTIKPINVEKIKDLLIDSKLIVTIEEHSIVGGLGSAVAEINTSIQNSSPQFIMGINDKYGKSGSYSYLLEKNGLDIKSLFERILTKYEQYR